MPFAKSGEASIYYEVEGSGPPLVLAHLYPRELNSWRNAGYVDALKNDFRLILIDSRGLGKSEKDYDPAHYEASYRAADVVAVLDDLGIEKTHYWGYSLGGRAGWCMAKYAPQRLNSLILGGVEPSPDNTGMRDNLLARLKEAIASGQAAEQYPGNDPRALAACLGGLITDPPFEDVMSKTQIPCLLYAGTADRFYAGSKKAAQEVIPGARFFEIPELDHTQGFERSDLVLPHVREFLSQPTRLPQASRPQGNGEGKVVIVTGGSYGIGRAITLYLAECGYRVVAFGLDDPQPFSGAKNGTTGTRAELEKRDLTADLLQADVSRANDVQGVVDFTIKKYGRIDGLVNNAAIHSRGTIHTTSEELWDRAFAVNVKGMFLCSRAVVPHMIAQGGGSIVNVSSGAAHGWPGLLSYSATKGAVEAFSFALAHDHYQDHIRVNIMSPGGGPITGMTENMAFARRDDSLNSVAGRRSTPEDHAYAVEFLLSDKAAVLSGCVIDVARFANQGGRLATVRSNGQVAGAQPVDQGAPATDGALVRPGT